MDILGQSFWMRIILRRTAEKQKMPNKAATVRPTRTAFFKKRSLLAGWSPEAADVGQNQMRHKLQRSVVLLILVIFSRLIHAETLEDGVPPKWIEDLNVQLQLLGTNRHTTSAPPPLTLCEASEATVMLQVFTKTSTTSDWDNLDARYFLKRPIDPTRVWPEIPRESRSRRSCGPRGWSTQTTEIGEATSTGIPFSVKYVWAYEEGTGTTEKILWIPYYDISETQDGDLIYKTQWWVHRGEGDPLKSLLE